jgi:hypothetical protein
VSDVNVDGHLGQEVSSGSAPAPSALAAASLPARSETTLVPASPDPAETFSQSAAQSAPPLAAPSVAPSVAPSAAPSVAPSAAPLVGGGCTAAQLRRFIKSRAYVPMHELRRRFEINGTEDDVTRVSTGVGHVYVGLPPREGQLLGELQRGGDIGYELSLDPISPIVIGVYPMRPISRS